jgi:two-component system sensor histidine kinase YesM
VGPLPLAKRHTLQYRLLIKEGNGAMHNLAQKLNESLAKRSFRSILAVSFICVSILPIIFLQLFSNTQLIRILQENMNQLSDLSLEQTKKNVELSLGSYEDILYQLYTDDSLIKYIDNIENDIETALNINQLNRILAQMCNAKDSIEVITVITNSDIILFYDKLKGSTVYSSWLGEVGMSAKEIKAIGMADFKTKILPTHFTTSLGSQPYYLFHLVHRIIDYKNVDRDIGVVILSLNENILNSICVQENPDSFYFIFDKDGKIITYPQKKEVGQILPSFNKGFRRSIETLLHKSNLLNKHVSIHISQEFRGWYLAGVINQSKFYDTLLRQSIVQIVVGILFACITGILIFILTSWLSRSMSRFEDVLKKAGGGDLTVSVNVNNIFSHEMLMIAKTFNSMMLQMKAMIEEINLAVNKRKDAEIKALEAQLNPHFLYNILDNINWMAIDNSQFELSSMITSLARILRYSIDNSNAIVPLHDEIEWLKQYMHLQKMRYKKRFEYSLDVDNDLLDYPVHKLLFQPFIENSIVHGFHNDSRTNILRISVKKTDHIEICIQDNGKGMDKTLIDSINNEMPISDGHIGLANAIGRIRMYYGETTSVIIESQIGIGTTVSILLVLKE